ncbi:hypothetical protein BAUCODRAFT_21807 [Baudoinia panamericana UAMH 10762]|uniref:Uncharacterized protein n=1 Tax=Baudoinia panamericana (strain UAMH 10762) TaxID=717646 RepID=M2NLW5_BAUPA|nr:uncharacterized protein BAUCODRAFT_21807 [Baudoinia panamericana UAMH 10762]EMD00156.1 hypothetical protein BAUCODRAFT_21807 [Baudoinia panamericana UAMH 10762]
MHSSCGVAAAGTLRREIYGRDVTSMLPLSSGWDLPQHYETPSRVHQLYATKVLNESYNRLSARNADGKTYIWQNIKPPSTNKLLRTPNKSNQRFHYNNSFTSTNFNPTSSANMHAFTISAFGLFAAIAAAQQYTQVITNNCADPVYLTYTDGSGNVGSTQELDNGQTFSGTYSGSGNSFGVTTTSDYWSSDKFVLGATAAGDSNLYWSVSETGDNAPQSFSVVPNNQNDATSCIEVDGYDGGATHVCGTNDETLTLTFC